MCAGKLAAVPGGDRSPFMLIAFQLFAERSLCSSAAQLPGRAYGSHAHQRITNAEDVLPPTG